MENDVGEPRSFSPPRQAAAGGHQTQAREHTKYTHKWRRTGEITVCQIICLRQVRPAVMRAVADSCTLARNYRNILRLVPLLMGFSVRLLRRLGSIHSHPGKKRKNPRFSVWQGKAPPL